MIRLREAALVAMVGLGLGGCTHLGAQPWERDVLARKSMQLNTEPSITGFHEHIYFSKEGAAGGRSFDGGGCGCN